MAEVETERGLFGSQAPMQCGRRSRQLCWRLEHRQLGLTQLCCFAVHGAEMEAEEAALLEAGMAQLGSADIQGQLQEVMVSRAFCPERTAFDLMQHSFG